jgi:hypothetical protein
VGGHQYPPRSFVNSLMMIQKKKRILGGRKRAFEVFGSLGVEGVINKEGLIFGGGG